MSTNKKYLFKEKQIFYWALIPVIFTLVLINIFYFFQIGSKKMNFTNYLLLSSLFLIILLLFYCLNIIISKNYISFSFGIGIFKKKILLNNIELNNIQYINIPMKYGIGLRYSKKGVIYNTKPGKGIILHLKKSKTNYIIVSNKINEIKTLLQIKK